MRVIAGKARGFKLSSFKGIPIRPTLDRVKESFFNQVNLVIEGARFLDLFAGTGNIGIEALSRGAAKVVFVESDRRARELIYKNLEKCHFLEGDDWELLKTDALRAVPFLDKGGYQFDLVYVDPPFKDEVYEPCLMKLSSSRLLTETALVVVESRHNAISNENYGEISLTRRRRVGDSCLSFFSFNQPNPQLKS
ncbi:MAG: 16S rRNA (guanine(966)-N(2))-methyltransferase RsmD [Nitrospinales bacterium]